MLIAAMGFIIASPVFAEGTKQFRPTEGDVGNLQINDKKRPFAMENNKDPFHRLYFHIACPSEKVFLGFQHIGAGSASFRIKDSDGNVVFHRRDIPNTTGEDGYINNYSEAVAGPLTSKNTLNGYKPIIFTPLSTGDHYIEFTTTLSNAYHFDLFDITVTDSDENPLEGRLWSYAWDLNTRSFAGRYNGSFYIYSDDGFVTRVDMNGIQPFGFVIACNSTGTANVIEGNHENRRSVPGNHVRPEYKIFLNNPDPNVYPCGEVPIIHENLHLTKPPFMGEDIVFALSMSTAGQVQIVLDINEEPGYQPDSEDVIIVKEVKAGTDTIIWDGKNNFGEYVTGGTRVLLLSSFSTGTTHLPIFDAETHENGYIVERIRPVNGLCGLYWDDTKFSSGTINLDTGVTSGRGFPYMFGDERTMNTWWNGYELDILNHFEFEIIFGSMHTELLSLQAFPKGPEIWINWITASEENCRQHLVEKSSDGGNFHVIGYQTCAGTTNAIQKYLFKDKFPFSGRSYYRIRFEDFDGNISYSPITYVDYSVIRVSAYPNPVAKGEFLNIYHNYDEENVHYELFSIDGKEICPEQKEANRIRIPENLSDGVYTISVSNGNRNYFQRIVVRER